MESSASEVNLNPSDVGAVSELLASVVGGDGIQQVMTMIMKLLWPEIFWPVVSFAW